jgi:hypothetical protein
MGARDAVMTVTNTVVDVSVRCERTFSFPYFLANVVFCVIWLSPLPYRHGAALGVEHFQVEENYPKNEENIIISKNRS